MRILLAEDDELLGSGVRAWLLRESHTVDWVKNGLSAWTALKSEHFDLMILDINLPRMDGIEVLKNVRAKGLEMPIIMISSHNQVDCRVQCLDLGADDFLVKPFDLSELRSRVRAIYRRLTMGSVDSVLRVGPLVLNGASQEASCNGVQLGLPRREFALLQLLMENANRVVSRQQAIQCIYGWGCDVDSNVLEVHIHNLRKRIGDDLIKTVRGSGYKLVVESVNAISDLN